MQTEKLQALDAILSLVITAIKWITKEIPDPMPGVEVQTIREILNNLEKTDMALRNLILYERGLFDEPPFENLKTLPPVKYIGKRNEKIKVTWEGN